MLTRPTDPTPTDELADLARRLRRLSPSWQNPEPFHMAKAEIAGALMRLSRRLAQPLSPVRPVPRPVPAPPRPAPPPSLVLTLAPRPILPCPCQRPRRPPPRRRHRYPRPPALPITVQPQLL
jgi:hypothetical protein